MTPKSYRGLDRDLDAMIAAACAISKADNHAMRDASARQVRVHRDAVFARVQRMAANAFRRGVQEARRAHA